MALSASVPSLREPVGVAPVNEYFARVGVRRIGWRAVKRKIVYAFEGQERFRHEVAQPTWKRGLFLYFGEKQLGDALMDLASRSLYAHAGITMDLLTCAPLAHLFDADPWFGKVACDPAKVRAGDYDFVITLSNKRRALQVKRQFFKTLPWLSLHGHFAGPDFDRGGFAAQRLAEAFGLRLNALQMQYHARQKLKAKLVPNPLCPAASTQPSAPLAWPANRPAPVAVCVGGVDERRTYSHWLAVIQALIAQGVGHFVLMGSANGSEQARALRAAVGGAARVDNWVGKTPVDQSRSMLANMSALVCADGGLMHLAVTTPVPVIALFAVTIRPAWRLGDGAAALALCSASPHVSDIAPEAIAKRVIDVLTPR